MDQGKSFVEYVAQEIDSLRDLGAIKGSLGSSVMGADIPYLYVGAKFPKTTILVQGAIHAREYVTACVVLNQVRAALKEQWSVRTDGIYFVPISNPDGVKLCDEGVKWLDPQQAAKLIAINGGEDFCLWKANINAVDLNTNFDAKWGTGKSNLTSPAPSDYIGKCCMSEPETRALAAFAVNRGVAATLSYHARGREIYWEFFQQGKDKQRDKRLAQFLSRVTGYKRVDGHLDSAGGYKDWCINKLGIPAFTLEILDESTPFPIDCTMASLDIAVNEQLPMGLLEKLRC